MATTPNPHKAARQHRKAYAVQRLIWSRLTTRERTNPALPEVVAKMTQGERDGWAIEAAVPMLSPESWALVVTMIADRVQDELRFRDLLDDHRAAS